MSLGHPSKLKPVGLASLLHQRHSTEVNKTLQDVWPSPGLVHCIYTFLGLLPLTKFASCKIHFISKSCVLLYCQHYCMALKQRPSAKLCIMVHGIELRNFYRGHHLYSAGRPSRWALAQILVTTILGPLCVHYICVWLTPIMIVCII